MIITIAADINVLTFMIYLDLFCGFELLPELFELPDGADVFRDGAEGLL